MGIPGPQQGRVANTLHRRKVLIIVQEAVIRETIRVLLGSFGYQCVFASNERQALALLEQESPGLAILDQNSGRLSQLTLRMQGRVIVITDAKDGPAVADRTGMCSLPQIQRDRLVHELESSLEELWWPRRALLRVTRVAQLICDSFRHPLPAGVRTSPRTDRRLVYERGALSIDMSFELKMDPPQIQLVGQILDLAKPDHRLGGVPVVLHGAKGPIAWAITNEFGEFLVHFDAEPNVMVEIETSKNHWLSLVSPSLEWGTKAI
jgi:hypothetical protein